MKAWQKGQPIERLQQIARAFQAHDGNRCLGAFSKVKENTVANWLDAGHLHEHPSGYIAARISARQQPIKDWRGLRLHDAPAGTLFVERVCGDPADIALSIRQLWAAAPASALTWKTWANHPGELQVAQDLALERSGTFISASSEIRSIYTGGLAGGSHPTRRETELDRLGIGACYGHVEPAGDIERWPAIVSELWQDHYSSYNKRRSWHAVSLRSFGGDPAFIEKPAEMSRAWRAEHPHLLQQPCVDTPLLDQLPGARQMLQGFDCQLERVRLMRLTPGGELTRHADITDRNAGTANGQIVRLHLPIITDPAVMFTSWNLDDQPTHAHMSHAEWWYLDVRKPHAARNDSTVERVHLVVDAVCNDWVREMILPEHLR